MNLDFKNENWFFQYWRPAIAWSYLVICCFDFCLTPLLLGLFCWWTKTPLIMWDPITLKGGGIYHASMGAITGVTAYSRGREKIAALQNPSDDGDHDDKDKDKDHKDDLPPGTRRQGDDC